MEGDNVKINAVGSLRGSSGQQAGIPPSDLWAMRVSESQAGSFLVGERPRRIGRVRLDMERKGRRREKGE